MTNAFTVYLRGKEIDIVFFVKGYTKEEVRKSLIEHDGYDHDISVKRRLKGY